MHWLKLAEIIFYANYKIVTRPTSAPDHLQMLKCSWPFVYLQLYLLYKDYN